MTAPPRLSVILPVHNQADHLAAIVDGYETALALLAPAHETLLVVNGSRDRSEEVCAALAARHPAVRVIASERGGWGLAVNLGIRASRGEHICYTNSARTSPSDLVQVAAVGLANPGYVVKANRKIREGRRRRAGSLLYNLQARALFDLPVWDINGTPKIFPRAFDALLDLRRDDDLVDLEFVVTCRERGYPIIEVPIFSARRHGGKSTTSMDSAFRMYRGAFAMKQDRR
ncbi:MAG: glycosyltransferase family 2 protein [Chloroflexota bacterium]